MHPLLWSSEDRCGNPLQLERWAFTETDPIEICLFLLYECQPFPDSDRNIWKCIQKLRSFEKFEMSLFKKKKKIDIYIYTRYCAIVSFLRYWNNKFIIFLLYLHSSEILETNEIF